MDNEKTLPEREEKAKFLIYNKVKSLIDPDVKFDVKIVWFSKTLRNWKALVITSLPDQLYYEVTYNGEKEETYIVTYTKLDNNRISDEEYFEMFFGNDSHS